MRVDKEKFEACSSVSVDCAVIQKTSDTVVVPMYAAWSGVGSCFSLWDMSIKDVNGNVTHGDFITHDSKDCHVRSDNKLVAKIWVDNLVIADAKTTL